MECMTFQCQQKMINSSDFLKVRKMSHDIDFDDDIQEAYECEYKLLTPVTPLQGIKAYSIAFSLTFHALKSI